MRHSKRTNQMWPFSKSRSAQKGGVSCAYSDHKVPGEIKRSRGGRWSWTFTLAQKKLWVVRWSWAAKIRLFLSLRFVPQQQCSGHCPCNCPARQLKQLLRSALVAAQWRGDTALTLSLFWRRSTVSPIFFGRYPLSSLHPFVPIPSPPPPPRPRS